MRFSTNMNKVVDPTVFKLYHIPGDFTGLQVRQIVAVSSIL
jgi:hypothetical protein